MASFSLCSVFENNGNSYGYMLGPDARIVPITEFGTDVFRAAAQRNLHFCLYSTGIKEANDEWQSSVQFSLLDLVSLHPHIPYLTRLVSS
jgi:hypothetical protein